MSFFPDLYGFLQFASGLKSFLRTPISVEEAKAGIRQRMQMRHDLFLQKIEQTIFAYPRSPYLQLLRQAGCELGDIQSLVKREGIEGTLHQLRQAGIYVTFEEFKGRKPVVRGSQTFAFRDTDFDNPLIIPHFQSSSGGTGGKPTRTRINLDHIAQSAPHWALWFAAHDWLANPLVFWTSSHAGVASRHLMCAKFGKPFVKWFTTVGAGTLKGQLISTAVHTLVRWAADFPRSEFVPISEAWRIGEYLLKLGQEGLKPCVNTSPSEAIRICLAMQDRGYSLRNVTFLLGSEPLTPTRRETIEASGAKAVPTYGFSEGGSVGSQCPNAMVADDIHISLDAYAVIQHARHLSDGGTVDALLLTALRPACPKVLFNTEIGDYAVLETKPCGCLFDELGYFQHLHTIRSFEKLTGMGVTFVGADLFHLLEKVFPQRFGGAVGDYQLVEEQEANGSPRYTLLVSPEVGPVNEEILIAAFLEELSKLRGAYRLMANLWAQSKILQVKRSHPLSTARGKIFPFRMLGLR